MRMTFAKTLTPRVTVTTRTGGKWQVRTYPRKGPGGYLEVGCWNGRRFAILRTALLERAP